MNGFLVPAGKVTFVDSNGRPLSNGKVAFYQVGTQTPKDTWKDFEKTVLNTNPIILDARGQASIYGQGAYRQVLKTEGDVTIWDQVITDPQSAGSISYTFPDGTDRPIQDLAGDDGADGIGYNGGTVGDALDALTAQHDVTKTYTIGTGGDYTTLNLALTDLSKIFGPVYKFNGVIIELKLLSGYIMREQVLLDGGIDLGWVRITSTDALVTIDETFITVPLSLNDNIYPAFGAINNSTLPVIGCKFQYASNLTAKDGVSVMMGSKVTFLPGAGVVRASKGLTVFYGSWAACYPLGLTQGGDGTGAGTATGVDFSYAGSRGLHCAYGSRASLGRSDFSHSDGDFGVYVIWESVVDCYQSNASYAINGTAFHARDGSILNCRESNGSHSKRAFHALHNGRINARSRLTGPTMIWIGDGAQFCTEYGVLASGNSQVEASELNAGSCTGSAGISASDASQISFIGGSAKSCTNRGVWAQNGSSISASGADVSLSKVGLEAVSASTIAAANVVATGCSDTGALAYQGSNIDVTLGTLNTCLRGVEAREGSTITARGASITGCTDRAVSAIDGGTVNAQVANLSGATLRAITARNGARVAAVGADCTGAGSWAAEVLLGSIITFNTATGTPLSIAPNTLTADGIIFQ